MSYLIDEIRNQGALVIEFQKKFRAMERQYVKALNNYNESKKWGDAREEKMLEQEKKIKDLVSEKGLDIMSKQIEDSKLEKSQLLNKIDDLQKKLSEEILKNIDQEKRNFLAVEKLTQISHHLEEIRRISIK